MMTIPIHQRFDTQSSPIKDRYSDKLFERISVPKRYLKIQYLPGFFHPYAYDEADNTALVEVSDFSKMSISTMTEEEVLKKMLPLLMALKEVQNLGEPYGNLSPDTIYDTPDGFFLKDLGVGKTYENFNDYSAYEYTVYHGQGTFSSDVYSVCVLMYELLTGIHLPSAQIRVDENSTIEPLMAFGISEKTASAIEKGLNLYADDRFPRVENLLTELFSEKQLENYKSDWEISVRNLKSEEASIWESIEQEMLKANKPKEPSDSEPVENSEEDEYEFQKKNTNKKLLFILGLVCVVFLAVYVLLSSNEQAEESPKELSGVTVPVSGTSVDYGETVSISAISAASVSASAVSASVVSASAIAETEPYEEESPVTKTPKPTKEPEKTPKPTKKPKKTKKPSYQTSVPSKTPVPSTKKKTPKPTKKPKSITMDKGKVRFE